MVSRNLICLVGAIFLLIGCHGDNNSSPYLAYEQGGFELPTRIRDSFAIDPNQVIGTIIVDGVQRPMQRVNGRYQADIPNLATNSTVVIQIQFSEQLSDGRVLKLAESNPQSIDTGTADRTITFTQSEFNYSFDEDSDLISNIIEREQGTDPYIPENTVNRPVVIQFNIPARINDPGITRIRALVAGTPRPHTPPIVELNYRVRVTGLVSSIIPVEIRITLEQLYNGEPIDIAVATATRAAGEQQLDITLTDAQFDFNLDRDEDGVLNIDEMQAGTNPLLPD